MVYIEDWVEFEAKSQQLYLARPTKTRYSFKYRHTDCQLVLKVTDDVVCLKYRTDQAADIKLFEKLNNFFIRAMSAKNTTAQEMEYLSEHKDQQRDRSVGKSKSPVKKVQQQPRKKKTKTETA